MNGLGSWFKVFVALQTQTHIKHSLKTSASFIHTIIPNLFRDLTCKVIRVNGLNLHDGMLKQVQHDLLAGTYHQEFYSYRHPEFISGSHLQSYTGKRAKLAWWDAETSSARPIGSLIYLKD